MDREVLKNKAGEIFGLNLGADYCAEHEWGIEPMWKAMKVDKNSMDLGRYRAASPQKDNLFYFTSSKVLYIEFSSGERYMNEIDNTDHKKYLKSVLHLHDTKYRNGINFSSAWDEKSFGVAIDSSDSDLLKFGKKLVQAIELQRKTRKKCCFMIIICIIILIIMNVMKMFLFLIWEFSFQQL